MLPSADDVFAALVDLQAKVQYLVDYLDKHGLLDDHQFTFPDGDTWTAEEQHARTE